MREKFIKLESDLGPRRRRWKRTYLPVEVPKNGKILVGVKLRLYPTFLQPKFREATTRSDS